MKKEQKPSAAGRWYLAGIGLSLALMGAFFVWAMWRSYARAKDMAAWPEVPCVIFASEMKERRIDPNSPPEYRMEIGYGYEFAGKARSGDHSTLRGNAWTSKMDVVEKMQAKYPAGSKTICHVDPANPDFSVLKVDSKAPGYSIWFPGLFVVGGLGIAFRAITAKR